MASFLEEFKSRAAKEGLIELPSTNAATPTNAQAPQSLAQTSFLDEFRKRASGVNAVPAEISAEPNISFQEQYQREGIPLDVDSGIPVSMTGALSGGVSDHPYWRVAMQSDPESKAAVLKKMYPDKNVRILDTGDVALEVMDSKTGKPKDVLVNPRGVDATDLMDLAVQAPEIAASIAAAVATQGRGFLKTVAQIVTSAFAGGFTGAARDVASRAAEGIPIRGEDIARERGVQTAFDIGAQGALGVIGKATRILSPFAREIKPGSLAFNLREGQDFLKENFGVDYLSTPGTRTGYKQLLAIEAAESPLPGSRGVFGELKEANEAAIQRAQKIALGEVLPEERIGEQAIGTLRSRVVEPVERAFEAARYAAIQKGDTRVLDLLDEAVGVPRGTSRVTQSQAGSVTMDSFQRQVARAEQLVNEAYAKVNELPGGSGDVLSGSPAARAAAEIRKEIPSVVKEVEKDTGLTDEFGNAIVLSAEERQMLKSGIPEGLLKALDDLESLKGGKVSLQTLTNMKKSAFDAIAAFKAAHGEAKDRWFTKIAGAYEKGIQEGIDATENAELKTALAGARDTYKREILPLERPGLRELAKGEWDAGQLSPDQVFDRMFSGSKAIQNYTRLKEVLGENNVAFRALKRGWLDHKLAKVGDGMGNIDPAGLESIMKSVEVDSPELAREMFGAKYPSIMAALKIRAATEKVGVETMDESTIRALMSLKDPTVTDLNNLMRMAKARDKAYVNGVFRDIRDGIALDDFRPAEFVNKLRNVDVSTSEIETVLAQLPENQRQAIATAEFYRLLNQASIREGRTSARMLAGEPVNISPSRLADAIGSGAKRERTELLLGQDLPAPGAPPPRPGEKTTTRMDTLKALVDVLAPGEASRDAFSSLGSLRQGQQIAELTRGPLRYAGNFAKNMFLATAYVRGLGRVLTNRQFDSEASAIAANTLIASEPFLRASAETFGEEKTRAMVAEAKASIDRFVMDKFAGSEPSPASRQRAEMAKMLRGEPARMRLTP